MTLRNLNAAGVTVGPVRAYRIPQPYDNCEQCHAYLQARRNVIARHLGQHISRVGGIPADVLHRLLVGVHARHTAGHPILPTPTGPTPRSVAYRQKRG